MEAPDDIPMYPLWAILNMDEAHLSAFMEFFDIVDTHDIRGKIAIELNRIGKLALKHPIDRLNLPRLVADSLPKPGESTDPTWGTVGRYQRMLYSLVTDEFRATEGIPLPVPSGPTDPTDSIKNRSKYFEVDKTGKGMYIGDSDGPYESALHNNLEKRLDADGTMYLLYGTITPDLIRQKEIIKMLIRSMGWMPDVRNKGWTMVLNQMADYLRQEPMPFVGLIMVDDGTITQVNGETILHGDHLDHHDKLIQSDAATMLAAAKDGSQVEDYFGDSSRNEGVWFEVPSLRKTSPRISLSGLRCVDDNEIIGTAKFRVLELPVTDIRLPKLKLDTLFM